MASTVIPNTFCPFRIERLADCNKDSRGEQVRRRLEPAHGGQGTGRPTGGSVRGARFETWPWAIAVISYLHLGSLLRVQL